MLDTKAQLSHALHVEAELDKDMNYRAGQRLVFRLNKRHKLIDPHDISAIFEISIFVSSKGPFYAGVFRRFEKASQGFEKLGVPPPGAWSAIPMGSEVLFANIKREIDAIMQRNFYQSIEGAVLSEIVPGKFTDMDGKPATVFEVLFSEID